MKNSLYDIFAEKYGPDIYICSDLHFGDFDCYKMRGLLTISEEKFNALELEMTYDEFKQEAVKQLDKLQIDKINKIAGKTSTLIILGDVGDIECVKKLKAKYKVLVLGNHDRGASYYKRLKIDKQTHIEYKPDSYYNKLGNLVEESIVSEVVDKEAFDNYLFDEVYEGTLQIGPKLILSHEPVDYKYALNIHGHTHSIKEAFYKEEITSGPTEKGEDEKFAYYHYCVIGEVNNYEPVRLSKLIKDGYLKDIPDIHRQTIDKATERKNSNEKI